jgi:probable F420-dependent oxidoreductase
VEANPGIIFYTDALTAPELASFAQRLEELEYDCLLVPEFLGREPFSTVSFVLANTRKLRVATGIANVYARDAIVAAQARQTLAELSGGRFILGLGVSHPPIAEAHGLEWVPPLRKMRGYLVGIEQTQVQSPPPDEPAPIWLAAHGPKMLGLAAERANAANTYLMPPVHTRDARERVGDGFRLNVVLPCCLCEDATIARKIGRAALSIYMRLPAYQQQWLTWGFSAADFENGGSDQLIDSLVAWGDVAAIERRMAEHLEAGATRIMVSPFNPETRVPSPHWKLLEALVS